MKICEYMNKMIGYIKRNLYFQQNNKRKKEKKINLKFVSIKIKLDVHVYFFIDNTYIWSHLHSHIRVCILPSLKILDYVRIQSAEWIAYHFAVKVTILGEVSFYSITSENNFSGNINVIRFSNKNEFNW